MKSFAPSQFLIIISSLQNFVKIHRLSFKLMEKMEKLLTKYIAWSLYGLIIALYIFSLWTLLDYHNAQTYRDWRETAQILKYSLWQAGLSAVLSLLFGTLLARSFLFTISR